MASRWGEGFVIPFKQYVDTLKTISHSEAPIALTLAAINRLNRLEEKFNKMAIRQVEILSNQKEILEILRGLENPHKLKGKSVKPPGMND